MAIELERACALIQVEGAALAAAAASVPPLTPVPSCPDWTMVELVEHHVSVMLFWANVVRDGRPDEPPAERPELPDEPASWYQNALDELVTELRAAGPDSPAWTWWGEPRTAGAIARHQVQEAMVHRWDAETAAGRAPGAFAADAALDGVDEFLSTVLVASEGPSLGGVVALAAADGDRVERRWVVDGRGDRPVMGDDGLDADAELRGEPRALVLALYRRVPMTALRVTGDVDRAERFLSYADLT